MKATFKAWNYHEEMTFEYSHSFEMYGFTWAIHRPRWFGEEQTDCWGVSETTTGLRIRLKGNSTFKTIEEAESEIRRFLEAKGEETTKKVVTKGRRQVAALRKRLVSTGQKT